MKKLFLSPNDKIIAGVCGGFAKYFDIDPIFMRLIAVFLALVTAVVPAVITYIIAAIIIPKEITAETPPQHREAEVK